MTEHVTEEFTPQVPSSWTTLNAIPALGSLYGKVLGGTVKNAVTGGAKKRGSRGGDVVSAQRLLPTQGYRVAGHRIGTDVVDPYVNLFAASGTVGHNTVPSVAAHIAAFPLTMALMAQPSFPMQLLGMVHISHHVQHLGDIAIGEPVTVTTWAQNLAPHRVGTTVEMWVQIHRETAGAEPELVWQSVAVYLNRGVFLAGTIEESGEGAHKQEFEAPVATASWKLDADTGRSYAKVSGDVNPIHMNSLTAKALGMPSMIAHGMYLAGRVLQAREPQAPFSWDIEFKTPVRLPGTVSVNFAHENDALQVQGWNAKKGKPHFTAQVTRQN